MESLSKSRNDDVDRLNYQMTSVVLCIFAAALVRTMQFGNPTSCIPVSHDLLANLTDGLKEYAERYCFHGHMYWANFTEQLPLSAETRAERAVFHYAWTPLILVVAACLFVVPKLMWAPIAKFVSGSAVSTLIEVSLAKWTNEKCSPKRMAGSKCSPKRMAGSKCTYRMPSSDYLKAVRAEAASKSPSMRRSPLTNAYLAFKALQLANSLFQLAVLALLCPECTFWVFGSFDSVEPLHRSANFPFETLCEVDLLDPTANGTQETFQCLLAINIEIKLCSFLIGCWLTFLSATNAVSLIGWIYCATYKGSSHDFIAEELEWDIFRPRTNLDPICLRRFIDDYMGLDGVTTLRLIKDNCGRRISSKIVHDLWTGFNEANETDGKGYDAQLEEGATCNGHSIYGGKGNKGKRSKRGAITANGVDYGGHDSVRLPI